MSENEGVIKRSAEQENPNETEQNASKKIKLTETTSLVLDKSQEEAIDKLVQNSHLPKDTEQTNSEISLPPITNTSSSNPTDNKNGNSTITSEQLLFALTSVPVPTDKKKVKQEQEEQENTLPTLSNKETTPVLKQSPLQQPLSLSATTTPTPAAAATQPKKPETSPTTATNESIVQKSPSASSTLPKQPPFATTTASTSISSSLSSPLLSNNNNNNKNNNNNNIKTSTINHHLPALPTSSHVSNGKLSALPTTINTTTTSSSSTVDTPGSNTNIPSSHHTTTTKAAASAPASAVGIPTTTTTTVTAPVSSTTNTITSLPLNNTTKATSTTTANNLGFNSLPDISAALRRLSSTPVIEQLTSSSSNSPRLNQNNAGGGESSNRKGSLVVDNNTASEILGNALAVVAANGGNQQRSSSIGNLAAFTANISNLLSTNGLEDTQKKLAAAVVMQRRKSNMMEATTTANTSSIGSISSSKKNNIPEPPKLVVNNSKVWKALEGMEERSLGFYLYTPQFILPNLDEHINGTVEIRIPARYLTYETTKVQKRALWGTDIYTDDSDIVAMVIHSGKYVPKDDREDRVLESNDPFALTIAGKTREAIEETRKRALSGKTWLKKMPVSSSTSMSSSLPNYDIKVILRVLPKLQDYASCIRNGLKSRHWGGSHDGVSLFVDKVEKIKKGEARLKGKSLLKTNMFLHEDNRKNALGLKEKKKQDNEQYVRKGRVKKTRRVMRMFQMRSEMMNEKVIK